MGVADGLDGGGVDGREGEVPAGDTQVSGLSAWRVAVPFPEVGRPAGGRGRCGDPVWGRPGLRSLQMSKRIARRQRQGL